jgi:hypothetical protein
MLVWEEKADAGIVKCVLEMALSVVLDGGIPKLLLLAIRRTRVLQ